MKTLAFAAFCAILSQCHARESSSPLSRPKRTLRMLESLFGSMRDTFGPLTAPAQSPPEVILATKYPIGVKYALYPTVRMQIRPVQQHVIYMQPIPAITAPALRPVRPLNTGAVEILRPVAPMVRLPKTKTTTTIHYEIIPLPVPMRAEPPAPPPPEPLSYEENDDASAPWSLDELPPPVPTSAPLNPADEPNVPWNLHALPPPPATKQPRGYNEGFGWQSRPNYRNSHSGYELPAIFNNKLVIPAQGVGLRNPQRAIFRPSPLQSEISVQPSIEVAAYSETHTLTPQQPLNEYVKRLRNLNSPKPQVFANHNNRLRREAPSTHAVDADHRPVRSVSPNRIFSSTFAPPRSEDKAGYEASLDSSAGARSNPFGKVVSVESYPSKLLANFDFVRADSAHPRSDHGSSQHTVRNISRDIRTSTSLSEPTGEHYVLITPRPVDYSRRLHAHPLAAETRATNGLSRAPGAEPQSSSPLRSAIAQDKRTPRDGHVSDFLDRPKGNLRFPPTGSLLKLPRRHQLNQRGSLLSTKKAPALLSVDDFFGDDESGESRSAAKSNGDQFWRSDYDNVEYFEPIIIDVGEDENKHRTDFGPKVEFKLKNFGLERSSREPLRLPDKLHQTVDRLSEALMHPPIFDAESEANEPQAVIVLLGNEIT